MLASTTVLRLGQELARLRQARRSRAVIEQAKGVLMERLGCSADEAFDRLAAISQRTNIKVAAVAAGLVGRTATDRPAALPDQEAARYHLACAAMAAAAHGDALAEALLSEGLRPLGATGVVLARREPDGTVCLAGSHGVPRGLASSWHRLPAGLKVGFLAALDDAGPRWLTRDDADRAGLDLLSDHQFRACLPLRRGDDVVGVVVVLWPGDPGLDLTGRAFVAALAAAAGRRLGQLTAEENAPVAAPAAHWLEAVVDGLPGSFALLCPILGDTGAIVDWRLDLCSPEAREVAGRRLLELRPQLVGSDLLAGFERALRTGQPFTGVAARTVWIRAARLGDGLLVTWRHDDQRVRRLERIRLLEETARAGRTRPEPTALPARHRSAPPDDTTALADTLRHLAHKVDRARHEQQTEALINRAKGMLGARTGSSIEAALDRLADLARRRGISLPAAAAEVTGEPVPSLSDAPPAEDFRPQTYVAQDDPTVDGDEIAADLWRTGLRRLGASAVVFGVLEPDGAVRLIGSYGLPAALVTAWRRTPSSLNVAYLRAVATDRPLWITRSEAAARGYELLGEGDGRACLPLHENGRIFGVASVLWPAGLPSDQDTRDRVRDLAEDAGRRLSQLLRATPSDSAASPAAHWAETILAALPPCYALLRPIRDETGGVADWRFELCSPGTVSVAGHTPDEMVGRRLHELYPHVLTAGIADAYRTAMSAGTPTGWGPFDFDIETPRGPVGVTMSGHAAKFGDGILIHWRREDRDELDRRIRQLEQATGSGWAEWDRSGSGAVWSAAVYELLRRDPRLGPVKLGALHRLVDPADEPAMIEAVRRVTRARQPVDLVVRLRRQGTVIPVRFAARPVLGEQGRVTLVRAVFQKC